MEVKEAIYTRRSIRQFLDKEVTADIIDDLLKCAMAAPSACNKRPWEFYVITNKSLLAECSNISKYSNYSAPLVIIVGASLKRSLQRKVNDFFYQDCSAAIENILLEATALGLGSVWCGLSPMVSPVNKVRKLLDLSDDIIPIGMIYLGYPEKMGEPRTQYEEKRIHYYK